uniref:PSI-F n=1 Tax=Octactis speculum TaxID=3111310 RepID=A0A7S2CHM7_9STRA|mmetsp:Transcript_36248/g.49046  ORF Transcript_36248/g.49046 Transcript_36248/m.49046 type:complete len:112 (+) Transcript_36248:55-390(+)|eukprot:CAMPEP_0185747666 /NCGR_PEP_ID=MMETSP1174-20130828/6292_1 /TAXON_ID=35687 /ORGANISM="Dictyocha speculum, Strain CCMP1381" /LENGTH=111 /DNA_ID=CAMNT_0028422943 /DNA_START=55 /DNA_END=390 /DNA_ORIENTATION=+
MFSAKALTLFLLVGLASAFLPASGPAFTAVARNSRMQPLSMGYVPDGLTEAQFNAMKKKEADKAKKNKKTKMKGSKETLTEWKAQVDKKFPNQPGAGHVYVKLRGDATYGK